MTYRIAVCTLAINDWYFNIVKYGVQTIRQYAEQHGYDFYLCNEVCSQEPTVPGSQKPSVPESRGYPWYKIKAIQKILSQYDFVFWIDADGFILRPEITAENFIQKYMQGKDLLCTKDWNSTLNTGVMLVRNSPFSHALLYAVWNNKREFDPNFHEQASMGEIYSSNRLNSQEKIRILPVNEQKVLFSYWANYYPDDTFFIHIARCSHDRVGFMYTLDKFCPIKMTEDEGDEFSQRLAWLKDPQKCRQEIEAWIAQGPRTNPSTRTKLYSARLLDQK